MKLAGWAASLALTVAVGCAGTGLIDDGTSLSFGPPNDGALIQPAALPVGGEGYQMPPTWAKRGLHFGTSELVAMVVHLGRDLKKRGVGRALAVGDLSRESGGPSAWHRSHQTGRDVDLIFFARDAAGTPIAADAMRRFGPDGASIADKPGDPVIYFDVAANWMLVRGLIDNRIADVQWIFISEDLKQLLIDHAIARGEPPAVIAAAAVLLHQPSRSLPHDDHMHVRVYCSPADVAFGCEEVGPYRWFKKGYKYRDREMVDVARRAAAHEAPPPARVASRPIQVAALAAPALPFRGFVPR
ncbi:MAG TPA: penicillin-insensitive murein endopeptidase [Kofleriaceae bacterium]|nr:penicillin-insensitive murein endopeptidase [Kofleriaceae bacterium]